MSWPRISLIPPETKRAWCPSCSWECWTTYERFDGRTGCDVCIQEDLIDQTEYTECPVCGKKPEMLYYQRGEIFGCDECIDKYPAEVFDE